MQTTLVKSRREKNGQSFDMIGRLAMPWVAPTVLFDYEAEEVDNDILLRKLQLLMSALGTGATTASSPRTPDTISSH